MVIGLKYFQKFDLILILIENLITITVRIALAENMRQINKK